MLGVITELSGIGIPTASRNFNSLLSKLFYYY